ncbi:MAG: DDE-type integrase/transposase/recombinase [Patescibacteria group bacterium]
MKKGELSVWQIAKQQHISPRHARRLYSRFKNNKHPLLSKPGRKPKNISKTEMNFVNQFYQTQPMGAVNMERILSYNGQSISHNRLHKILKRLGLSRREEKKSKRRKWIRFERKHSNSLWHIDWSTFQRKQLVAILDDASRLIVGYGLFDSATSENSVKILNKAVLEWGCPRQLLSDNGTQFLSIKRESCPDPEENIFQKRMNELGIQHIKTRIHHPQTNGKLERWWKTADFLANHFGSLPKAVNYYNYERPHMSLDNGVPRTPIQAFIQKA